MTRPPHTRIEQTLTTRTPSAKAGTRPRAGATAADRARQVLAALLTVAAVVLLPGLLVVLVGWPLPVSVPTAQDVQGWVSDPLSSSAVVDVLAVVFWVAWAHFVVCVVVEALNATVRRGLPAWRVPGGGVSQEWARRLVMAVLVVGVTAPLVAVAGSTAPTLGGHRQPAGIAATQDTTGIGLSTGVAETRRPGHAPAPDSPVASVEATPDAQDGALDGGLRRYVVGAPAAGYSENLWDIAENHLGDGLRWSQIYALNTGREQPDGDVLDDPDLIRPGWQLRMPPDATDLPVWSPTLTPIPASSSGPGAAASSPDGTVASLLPGTVDAGHVVEPGDTLWQIAQERLGDGRRYDELVAAAAGRRQPDGEQLVDPDLIRPGWIIPVPADATPVHAAPAVGPESAAADDDAADSLAAADPDDAVPSAPPVGSAEPGAAETPPISPRVMHLQQGVQINEDLDDAAEAVDAGADEAVDDGVEDGADAPWMLTGLSGAGVVLAGALWWALRRGRRAQFRARRPGRSIAAVPVSLAAVERSVAVSGSKAAPTVQTMDLLLRRLAMDLTRDLTRDLTGAGAAVLPAVAAVQLTGTDVVLHLGAPMKLPAPWVGSDDDLHWSHTVVPTVHSDDRADDLADGAKAAAGGGDDVPAGEAEAVGDQPAPYPLLVAVGSDDESVWLLNLEHLGAVSITGDPGRGRDFARHLVAELALQVWSSGLLVDCIGLGGELVPLSPERLRFHTAADSAAVVGEVIADAVALVDRSAAAGLDAASGRGAQVGDDTWPARVLLADLEQPDQAGPLDHLLELVHARAGRTGTAVLLTCGTSNDQVPGVRVDIDAQGRLRMPASGLDVRAVGLPQDEATGCALLVAAAEDRDGAPIPVDDGHEAGWHRFADLAGGLRPELTLPREGDAHVDASSLLEAVDEEYLACAATTPQDLQELAPRVTGRVRAAVEDADPTLDQDLTRWSAQDCDLPRLTLLGPVRARTRGVALAKRKPYYTELLAYLWSRPHGATPAEVAGAFGLTPARVRTDIKVLRDWLGTNPRTGRRHLPDANRSTAAAQRGVGVYQVEGLLVDADLFRRLRVRAQARGGATGLLDLRAALDLVVGRPCDQLRPGGWSWMLQGHRLDEYLLCAVVDVAHTVSIRCLRDGDLDGARAAAELSLSAAPEEEIPRLDLAAVARAEGDARTAQRIALDQVCNRSDDGQAPIELSERTQQVLERHDWLHTDTAAG